MPMTCTGGRVRCFNPYCTARFTIVATLFQFTPYWRAVPCQLNARASRATSFERAVATPAHGTGDTLLAAADTAASAATTSSIDHAIPAPAARCAPSDTAAGRVHNAGVGSPDDRCRRP